jgi:hypothetical protein
VLVGPLAPVDLGIDNNPGAVLESAGAHACAPLHLDGEVVGLLHHISPLRRRVLLAARSRATSIPEGSDRSLASRIRLPLSVAGGEVTDDRILLRHAQTVGWIAQAARRLASSSSTGAAARGGPRPPGATSRTAACGRTALGLPFAVVGIAFERSMNPLLPIRRHYPVALAIGGLLLLSIGEVELTGAWA